jgi:very-long-chain (3R)-3-hydroxyacyl-CoA dehydratase
MPNTLNFTFSYFYFMWFIMLSYIPLFPHLYMHMFSQRKKILGADGKRDQAAGRSH